MMLLLMMGSGSADLYDERMMCLVLARLPHLLSLFLHIFIVRAGSLFAHVLCPGLFAS